MLKGISWNTVARWLERAAAAARRFNDAMTQGLSLEELQLDEIRTFAPRKSEVCLGLHIDRSDIETLAVNGSRRSYRNTERLLRETIQRGEFATSFLIATDGFKYYKRVVRQLLGPACLYGQVQKTWRNNRVIKVERTPILCIDWRLKEALLESEVSSTLNTSFIERLQLTIRQGSSYLCRRSACHSRSIEHLENHLELLRCHYNFVRPHGALKFGTEIRTPAMQAGLAKKRLTFRDIFLSVAILFVRSSIVVIASSRPDAGRSVRLAA